MNEIKEVSEMTEEQLRRQLITCDYRGREFKTLCLDELLRRASAAQKDSGHV